MPGGRPKGSKTTTDTARDFVARVEALLRKAGKGDNLENFACRLITDKKQPQTAQQVWSKLLAYKYGDPKQSIETKHNITVEMKVEDADALIRSYFVAAAIEQDRTSESDQGQAAQQDRKLLPS